MFVLFGNPAAGTKLMLNDITAGFNLSLRVAVVDNNGQTEVIYLSSEDYGKSYDVAGHPVLEKLDRLFEILISYQNDAGGFSSVRTS